MFTAPRSAKISPSTVPWLFLTLQLVLAERSSSTVGALPSLRARASST